MARRFGMIGANVWDSDKFTGLEDDSLRLTYIYLCTTHHGCSVGVFKMPPAYLGVDRGISKADATAHLKALHDAQLIEIGAEDQIRVTRWFHGPSGANSPSTGSSFVKAFMDQGQVKAGDLRTRAALEMIHSTLETSRGWNPETKQIGQMLTDFTKLLTSLARTDHQAVVKACDHLGISPLDEVWNTMWDTVLHTIPNTMSTYIHEHWTLRTEKEKDTESDTGHGEGDSARAQDRRPASSPNSSPPKGGGRQSGGKVSEETKGVLNSIGQCDECSTKLGYGDCKKCKSIKK